MRDIRQFSDAGEHHFVRCPRIDTLTLKKFWGSEMKKKENGRY
jgi:hypothetical protein